MNRREVLRGAVPAAIGLALSAEASANPWPGKTIELPIGKWVVCAENNGAFAWLLRADGELRPPHRLPQWIGRLRLASTGHTVYSEVSAATFEDAKMILIAYHKTWFVRTEDYTPGPWPEDSELANTNGWNPHWMDRYR